MRNRITLNKTHKHITEPEMISDFEYGNMNKPTQKKNNVIA